MIPPCKAASRQIGILQLMNADIVRAARPGARETTMTNPAWLDRREFPFVSRFMDMEAGRMHYVDEGAGDPMLMVHGTPTWSFVYRHLIREFSRERRVIAVDHLGFGLSDKRLDGDYRPQALARHLAAFVERLGLERMTLVVHDFGGPIGLSYAIARPERVRALVLFNTWMWSLRGTSAERISRFMAGRIGRWLYTRTNLSPRVLLKAAYGDKRRLTPAIHQHYTGPFQTPATRTAPWVFARELMGSDDWYEDLWAHRERLADVPALVLWGMKDPAFTPAALERWKGALRKARVVEYPAAGHVVQEEAPEEVAREIRAFLRTVG